MMNSLDKAIEIALRAHKGQEDKAGKPYILHPLRVMNNLEDEIEMVAAVLHDVIEDSPISAKELKKEGIPDEAIEIVQCLTRSNAETYEEFIQRITYNKKAVNVKIKDLEDNMNFTRLQSIQQKDLDRMSKYHKALILLKKQKQ